MANLFPPGPCLFPAFRQTFWASAQWLDSSKSGQRRCEQLLLVLLTCLSLASGPALPCLVCASLPCYCGKQRQLMAACSPQSHCNRILQAKWRWWGHPAP